MAGDMRSLAAAGSVLLVVLVAGCGARDWGSRQPPGGKAETGEMPLEVWKAVAFLHPTEGNVATGAIIFKQEGRVVSISGVVENLEPGEHGFHINEYGDCSGPGAETTGGHYNPGGNRHGGPSASDRHAGDLGNITADSTGTAPVGMIDSMISLNGEHSVIGRAVVVYEGEDDLHSQPSGDAGLPVACGVIGIAETE